jgi:hypothetical protein
MTTTQANTRKEEMNNWKYLNDLPTLGDPRRVSQYLAFTLRIPKSKASKILGECLEQAKLLAAEGSMKQSVDFGPYGEHLIFVGNRLEGHILVWLTAVNGRAQTAEFDFDSDYRMKIWRTGEVEYFIDPERFAKRWVDK